MTAQSEAETQRKEALLQQAKYMDEANAEKVSVGGVECRYDDGLPGW